MMLSNRQSREWQEKALEFLKENEFEWVTVRITSENVVYIYPDKLPGDIEEFEDDTLLEVQGEEIIPLKDKALLILVSA